MKVAVTGSTGFTGKHLVRELARRGHSVSALLRPSSDISSVKALLSSSHVCDLTDPASMTAALDGVDALINVVTLGTGLGPPIVRAAEAAGIPRVIFTSTTGIYTTLNPASKGVRLAAERIIDESALAYSILRPTMIYGTPGDRNMWRLITWINRTSVVPLIGDGQHKQQPVHVEDLAWALCQAAESPSTARRAYNISGGSILTFRDVIDTIADGLQRRIWKLRLPLGPIHGVVRTLERMGIRSPVKSEQLLRLNEDKVFPHLEASRDFEYKPRSFTEGIRSEIGFLTNRD
ncbi:MAG: NAD(P)H-binding protein [Acidobacteriota bacterium]